MKKVLLWLTLVASVACAQEVTTKGQSAVVSQVVDGDGWQTWITLSNIDATPSQYIVYFFKNDGTPMPLTTDQTVTGNGTFVFGILPAHGAITIKTPGTSATLTEGWAKVQTVFNIPGGGVAPGATIAGSALFLRPQSASRPTETAEPLDFSQAQRWAFPFDHTNGYTTGLALLNQSDMTDSVSMTFYDESGVVLMTLPPFNMVTGQHEALTLTNSPDFSSTIGHRGTAVIQTTGPSINMLGLRTSPAGDISGITAIAW